MAEVGFTEVETYISCRQNTAAQYIATGPIVDLRLSAKRWRGAKGGNALAGTGGFGFGGDADGGPGGGGGGGDGRAGDCDGRLVKWGGYCCNNNLRDRA